MRSLRAALACPLLAALVLSNATAEREKKVLLIGLDGVRPDCLQLADTPTFDRLAAMGALSHTAQTSPITVSGPSWSLILTGAVVDKHGVTGNDFINKRYDLYPSFIDRLEDLDSSLVTASVVTWTPINEHIITNADYTIDTGSDDRTTRYAALLLSDPELDAMFVHIDETDGAGHRVGFDPEQPEYLAAIERADRQVGEIIAALEARPTLHQEDWLVLSTTDHGGGLPGILTSHGLDVPSHRTVYLLATHFGGEPNVHLPEVPNTADIVPTLLTHMGVGVESVWDLDGHPLQKTLEERAAGKEAREKLAVQFNPDIELVIGNGTLEMSSPTPGAQLFYALENTLVDRGTNVYTAPISLAATTTVIARAFDVATLTWGPSTRRRVLVQESVFEPELPLDALAGLEPGLVVQEYVGRWDVLPDFTKLDPIKVDVTTSLTHEHLSSLVLNGLTFEGYLLIPEAGTYRFFTTSDDGSALDLHGRRIVDNDGHHGSITKSGPVALEAGLHPIRVEFFQGQGGFELAVAWQRPNGGKEPIPADLLFHRPD